MLGVRGGACRIEDVGSANELRIRGHVVGLSTLADCDLLADEGKSAFAQHAAQHESRDVSVSVARIRVARVQWARIPLRRGRAAT